MLKPIQMLWVNLIMDTLASLALATEPPTNALLDRPPNSLNEYIVNKKMIKHIICQAIYQLIVMTIIVFFGFRFLPEEFDTDTHGNSDRTFLGFTTVRSGLELQKEYGESQDEQLKLSRHFTYAFNIFVMMQIFNFINARKIDDTFNTFSGIFNSAFFLPIVVIILILQFLIVTFGSVAFQVTWLGVGPIGWIISFFFGILGMVVNLLAKLIPEDVICPCGMKGDDN